MANTDQDTVVETKRVAQHALLDQSGATTDAEEAAWGISYKLHGLDTVFTWTYGKHPDADRMLSIMGAKTLATNESSQVRNNPKGAGTVQEQMDAVVERFADLESGKWVDRTREGVGARVDKDKLAEAICENMILSRKSAKDGTPITPEYVKSTYLALVRAKLESDKGYQANARNTEAVKLDDGTFVPSVNDLYAKLVGKTTKTVDDLVI